MKIIVIIQFLLISFPSFSQTKDIKTYMSKRWKLSKTQINYLVKGKVLADSEVDSKDKVQTFDLQASALHQKKCKKALRKLSKLELYQDWIGFIKSSTYQEKSHLFTIKADHPLLPFPMLVHISVDRPTKEGRYNFTFPTGMFRGLTGFFDIIELNKRCLFYAESHWKGKKSKIPNFVIELFSETLSKMGGELLMRKTR